MRRTARAGAEIVPQIVPQPACLLRDLGGAARPPGRILGDELHHQGAHIGRHRPGQRRNWVVAVRARYVRRLAHEGRCPGQAFVSNDSQCIQITGRCGLSTGYPLRCQVLRLPVTIPVTVPGTEPIACEMPQSVIFTVPLEASRRFPGLISR